MASRQEEKERRRREREEAERAAQRSGENRKRLGIVLGAALLAAIAVIVVLAVAAGGDDNGPKDTGVSATKAPNLGTTNLSEAARKAGCKLTDPPSEGRGHTSEAVTYKSNPPTSGTHDPVPSDEGIYPSPPDVEQSVHSLEHGRINFQYRKGTPPNRIAQLEGLFNEEVKGEVGYHTLLFQNQTGMKPAVAATAWTHSLTCDELTDESFDALRAFRLQYVDKGPEFQP